ncbi:3-hydroxyacyl-CoA dehydrogenase [Mesorhizobium robiniae]|uniref:3-hydroxyacyl-CoA dehydrogenase n=1 Tax=Mesorhizobium robiniae TaxID=559315 RepID=A0ABV2GXX1_9HYPH|nr:3-hydroxyacyl-CoA dehydrogenase NAD-binding domain-containing protein [Mesorhizobium sp. ZC-5]MCV3243415.1 3-hydroxyacyl-CoA dehydrogenase NAD-binding domain-containing protein [Mesorhizobium sp. ZC-5]
MDVTRFSGSVYGSIRDGVLVVTIDNPPVNALSTDVREGLCRALDHAVSLEGAAGVVITGAGRVFVGGADIREFATPPVAPILPDVTQRIEQSDKPVVAAINGAALGGGAEIALACHGRVASAAAIFGLPEVKLGIVPGAGGTQRLPRLVGTAHAVEMIGSGRSVKADEAKRFGLIDALADDAVAEAVTLAHGMANAPLRRTGELAVVPADEAETEAMASKVLAKARGQVAPAEAVRLVRAAALTSLEKGLADERTTFLRLRDSDEAAALRHVFFAERQAGKVAKLEGISPRPVVTVGIVGLGLMGSGIAVSALTAGYCVIGVEQTDDDAQKGRTCIVGLLGKAAQSGRLTPDARKACLQRLATTADLTALSGVDLAIEAVFDNLAIKTDLLQRLDGVVRPDAILATNTSYLNPDELAAATIHPERIVGLHFFSPANVMRLVEVIDCAATRLDVLATALAFAKRLGKLPVVCSAAEGFIGNRIFSAYRREAEFMVEDGAMPEEIDAALEAWGFPMGIFAVNDMAGLEIAWARRKRQAATRNPNERYVEIADQLCEAGRLGRKTGCGWYTYSSGEKTVDPQVTALIETARKAKGIVPRQFSADEIVAHLLRSMADEGSVLLSEGIAGSAGDIDLVMINGYGFPAHKGGPMFQARLKRDSHA